MSHTSQSVSRSEEGEIHSRSLHFYIIWQRAALPLYSMIRKREAFQRVVFDTLSHTHRDWITPLWKGKVAKITEDALTLLAKPLNSNAVQYNSSTFIQMINVHTVREIFIQLYVYSEVAVCSDVELDCIILKECLMFCPTFYLYID